MGETDTGTLAVFFAIAGILLITIAVILSSSSSSTIIWNPQDAASKHRIACANLVHDAHAWFTSAKQEEDFVEALTRVSYGIANLRAVQTIASLDEIGGVHLPDSVDGAKGLLAKLTDQQQRLSDVLKIKISQQHRRSEVEAPQIPNLEERLKSAVIG